MSSKHNQHPIVLFFSSGLDLVLQAMHWFLERVLWLGFSCYNCLKAVVFKVLDVIEISVRILVLAGYLLTVPFEWFADFCLKYVQRWHPSYQLIKTVVMLGLVLPLAFIKTIISELRQQVGRLLAVGFKFIQNLCNTLKALLNAIAPDDTFISFKPLNIDLWLDGLKISFITDRLALIEAGQKDSVFMALIGSDPVRKFKKPETDDAHSWISLSAFLVADGLNMCIQLFNMLFLDWANVLLNAFNQRIDDANKALDEYKTNLAQVHVAFCKKMDWPDTWVDTWLKVVFCLPKCVLAVAKALIQSIHVIYKLALEWMKAPLLLMEHLVLTLASTWDAHFPCHEVISSNAYKLPYPAQIYRTKMQLLNEQSNHFGCEVDPSVGIKCISS